MNNINCIIPIRSASVGIKDKNVKKIGDTPLICNTIEIALKSKIFKKIIIALDSNRYKKIIMNHFQYTDKKKIFFYERSKKSSLHNSMTEIVISDVINKFRDAKYVYFLQCTSPFLSYNDLKKSKSLFSKGFDSFFSGNIIKQFLWQKKNQVLRPINYQMSKRPMRQNHDGLIIENGSFYAFNAKKFLKIKSRLFGKIGCYLVDQYNSIEIDEPRDLKFANILKDNNFFYG